MHKYSFSTYRINCSSKVRRWRTMDAHNCIGAWNRGQKGRSYKVQMIKMWCIINRIKRHVRTTPISAEDYLRKQMLKVNRPQTSDKLTDSFALLNQHKHLSYMGMEREDILRKTMQHPKHRNANQPGEMKQSSYNGKKKIARTQKQTCKQETVTMTRLGKIWRDFVITRTQWY